MIRLGEHLSDLEKLMNKKGYDGYFLSNFGFPDKLSGTLRKHIFQCYTKDRDINPIHLSTYSKWKDEDSPYVRCDFTMNYDDNKGFSIEKMEIHCKNIFGRISSSEIIPKSNNDLPDSKKANSIEDQTKRGRKL